MEYLPKLLDSIKVNGWYGQSVLIVDTGSTDPEFKNYIHSIEFHDDENGRLFPFNVYVDHNRKFIEGIGYVYGGYDTGAYLRAYEYNKESEDVFIFLQDSVEIKDSEWGSEFFSRLEDDNAVAWLRFTNRYDTPEQEQWTKDKLGESNYDFGVFAPIFAIKTKALDKLVKETNIMNCIPENKEQQMAMERGWAIALRQAGLRLYAIDWFDIDRLKNDDYRTFKKNFPERK